MRREPNWVYLKTDERSGEKLFERLLVTSDGEGRTGKSPVDDGAE